MQETPRDRAFGLLLEIELLAGRRRCCARVTVGGLPLVRRVDATAVKLKEKAEGQGSTERFEAYAADAVAQLVVSSVDETKRASGGELVIVCDLYAWRRGHAHPVRCSTSSTAVPSLSRSPESCPRTPS